MGEATSAVWVTKIPQLPESAERSIYAECKAELKELTGKRTRAEAKRYAAQHPVEAAEIVNYRVTSWFYVDSLKPEQQPACRAGCSACCHIVPDVTRGEAMLLREAIAELPAEEREDIAAKAEIAASKVREAGSGGAAWPLRCPLLGDDGRCRVYEARPAACRSYASESREACEAALRREPSVVALPLVARSAQLTHAAFRDLMGENHLTIKPLPVALAEARGL